MRGKVGGDVAIGENAEVIGIGVARAGKRIDLNGEAGGDALVAEAATDAAKCGGGLVLQDKRHAISAIAGAIHAEDEAGLEGGGGRDRQGRFEESRAALAGGVGGEKQRAVVEEGAAIELELGFGAGEVGELKVHVGGSDGPVEGGRGEGDAIGHGQFDTVSACRGGSAADEAGARVEGKAGRQASGGVREAAGARSGGLQGQASRGVDGAEAIRRLAEGDGSGGVHLQDASFGPGAGAVQREQHPVARRHDVEVGVGGEAVLSLRRLGEGEFEETQVGAHRVRLRGHFDEREAGDAGAGGHIENGASADVSGGLGDLGADREASRGRVELRWGEDLGIAVVGVVAGKAAAARPDASVGEEKSERVVVPWHVHRGHGTPLTGVGVPNFRGQDGAGVIELAT